MKTHRIICATRTKWGVYKDFIIFGIRWFFRLSYPKRKKTTPKVDL